MQKLQKPSILITLVYALVYFLLLLLWPENLLGIGIIAVTGPLIALTFLGMAIYYIEDKVEKKFWLIVFIGGFSYFVGELIWRYHLSYLKTDYPFSSWHFFYYLFVILYSIAVLYKLYVKRRQYRTIQLFFDSFIIMTVLTTITWVYFLRPLLHYPEIASFDLIISLSYPIAHLGLLIGVVMLFLSSKSTFPPIVLIINTTVMFIYTIAETYFLFQSIYYTFNHLHLINPIWNICIILIGLSSFYSVKIEDNPPQEKKGLAKLFYSMFIILPYLSITVLVILALIKNEDILSIFIGGAVVLFLIVIRQVITIFENEFLVRQHKERTEELEIIQLELLESQQRYKSLFDYHQDAIFSIDRKGNIITSNHSFKKISGYSFEEWGQKDLSDRIFKEFINSINLHFQRALHGVSESFELAIRHKTGKRIELNLTFVPIEVNSQIIGVYGIAKDITEKKKTEEMLIKSEKLSVVSRLAAGVAHEIRNPLTTIKGFLQLSYDNKGSLNQNYLDILLSELNHVEMVIDDFMYLANPHHETVFTKANINDTLQEAVKLLKTNANLNKTEIGFNLDSGIPIIECIENQMKQVFINLIQNAIEATEKGGNIYIESKVIDDMHICIRFIDEGCGISEERLHKLGEPYYSTKEKGTGIGLMISYKIIELHQGQILISSKVNKGTTIEIILPISKHARKALMAI